MSTYFINPPSVEIGNQNAVGLLTFVRSLHKGEQHLASYLITRGLTSTLCRTV